MFNPISGEKPPSNVPHNRTSYPHTLAPNSHARTQVRKSREALRLIHNLDLTSITIVACRRRVTYYFFSFLQISTSIVSSLLNHFAFSLCLSANNDAICTLEFDFRPHAFLSATFFFMFCFSYFHFQYKKLKTS